MELQNIKPVDGWGAHLIVVVWMMCGFVGAGVSVGYRLSRGEKVNGWGIITALVSGIAVSGTVTKALVDGLSIGFWWSFPFAFFLGVGAMGMVIDAFEGRIMSVFNKLRGKS